jgi:hypothetical protein
VAKPGLTVDVAVDLLVQIKATVAKIKAEVQAVIDLGLDVNALIKVNGSNVAVNVAAKAIVDICVVSWIYQIHAS